MLRVVPLGRIPTGEGPAHAVLAMLPNGTVDLEVGSSWVAAAEALASRHRGRPVACDPSLATVARRHRWSLLEALDEELLRARATIALAMYARYPPGWGGEVEALIDAWRAFFPLRLWEQVPAEMALPLIRRARGRTTRYLVGLLGQSGLEHGLAVYASQEDFDALWNGAPARGSMVSALAEREEPLLQLAFEAIGVPAPVVSAATEMRPRSPSRDDVQLVTAVMRLFAGVLQGATEVSVGPGDTLAFERSTPGSASPRTKPAPSRRASKASATGTPRRGKPKTKKTKSAEPAPRVAPKARPPRG